MSDSTNSAAAGGVLAGTLDRYGGMNVPAKSLPDNDHDFAHSLHASMESWKSNGVRGVWISVPIERSSFISIAAELGFKFHHARDSNAVITNWLPADDPNKLPHYPFTNVGVGGLVVNEKQEILVVREKFFGSAAPWKLPGGMVDPKEELHDAAMREVIEETNIKTEFVSLLGFRHFHGMLFGTSDLYFIVRLKPLSEEITFDTSELLDARWMPIDEYITTSTVSELNRWIGAVAKNHLASPSSSEYSCKRVLSYDKKSMTSFFAVQDDVADAKL